MYSNKNIYCRQIVWLLCFLLAFFSGVNTGMVKTQSTNATIIKGKVIDALSKEALIGVSIIFPDTSMSAVLQILKVTIQVNTAERLKRNILLRRYDIGNIFNFFRIDLVKRLTYLDHPNVSDIGIRGRFKFDF